MLSGGGNARAGILRGSHPCGPHACQVSDTPAGRFCHRWLTRLNLSTCGVDTARLAPALALLPRLRSLVMVGAKCSAGCANQLDEAFRCCANAPGLTYLTLSKVEVPPEAQPARQHLPSLAQLHLIQVDVQPRQLAALFPLLPQLHTLDMYAWAQGRGRRKAWQELRKAAPRGVRLLGRPD